MMLQKHTFFSDEDLNKYFASQLYDVFLVKFVVTFNPFTQVREYHVIASTDEKMRQGMHQRRVVKMGVVSGG
jgi:hypothetical protein